MWELPAKDFKVIIIKKPQPSVINSLGKIKNRKNRCY